MKRILIVVFCMVFALVGCSEQQVEIQQEIPVSQLSANAEPSEKAEEEGPSLHKEDSQAIEPSPTIAKPADNTNTDAVKINPKVLSSKRKTSYDHFNTVCFAVVFDDFSSTSARARFEQAWQEIDEMLTVLESKVSVNLVDSDIYRFNEAKHGESIAISTVTAEIVARAIDMYALTAGAYNPAVANLVDLWGFSPRFHNREAKTVPYDRPRNEDGSFDIPDQRYIEAFKALADFSGVALNRNENGGYTLTKKVKDIELDGVLYSLRIDLGGIAKGYGADQAVEILKRHGYQYGLVNLGLSSMKLLERDVSDKDAPGENMWSISISDPDNPTENYLTGFGKNAGVSTSGTYEVQYTVGGREYSHIIDPSTGEPTQSDVVSATLWGGEAGNADALSTALCVMGKEKAIAFMDAYLKDYNVAMLVRNGGKLELVTNMAEGEYVLSK